MCAVNWAQAGTGRQPDATQYALARRSAPGKDAAHEDVQRAVPSSRVLHQRAAGLVLAAYQNMIRAPDTGPAGKRLRGGMEHRHDSSQACGRGGAGARRLAAPSPDGEAIRTLENEGDTRVTPARAATTRRSSTDHRSWRPNRTSCARNGATGSFRSHNSVLDKQLQHA
jgi:hypothetical protein